MELFYRPREMIYNNWKNKDEMDWLWPVYFLGTILMKDLIKKQANEEKRLDKNPPKFYKILTFFYKISCSGKDL